nr:zinc finger protein Xfin-like isoform X3 [Aedes albopictus]
MRRHLQSHHGKQMVRSQYRRRIVTDESPKVDDSLPTQHAEPAFPCSHCPKKFSHNRSRLHHERKVHNAGPSTPRESNNTTPTGDSEPPPPSTSPTDVAEPSEEPSAEPSKSYECSYCKKPFFRKHSLQRHESTVHRASRIEQPNVSATPAKQNSEQPIKETSNTPSSKPSETSFQCSLCPKMFSHKHYLQRHEVAMHNAPPPPIIDQDSTNASATSTEESSSQPTGKDTTTSSTTPVQSSYKCSRCPKMFSHQHYLLRHEQLMHGVAPAIGAELNTTSPAGSEPRSVSVASNEDSSVHLAGKIPITPSPQQAPSSFPCSICPKAFTLKHNLDRHVKTIHGEPQLHPEPLIAPPTLNAKPAETLFRCSLCPKMFSHEHYLQRHANLVHGGAPIIGQEPAALASPVGSEPPSAPPATGGNPIEPSTKSVESLFHCSLCPKMFSHEHFLLRHAQLMHNASPIGQESNNASAISSEPPVASAAIKKESDARPIVEIPTESMPAKTTFKCSRCPKMFSGEHFLLRHEQLVHNAISIKQEPTSPSATNSELPSTPRAFTEENNAQTHGETPIDPSPKSSDLTYQCSICQKLFCRKYSLQRHESTVHRTPQTLTEENTAVRIKIEPGIASPPTIGKNPATPSAPSARQQSRSATPTGNEPRSVSATSATEQNSAQPDDDESRNASPSGEESAQSNVLRPHICKDCGEQFSTSRDNYYHMVEKHRDSLFQCPECPSAFILQQSLDRHKQTHKKRPVADVEVTCSKCGLEFPSKEEKLKHMTDEHGENLFKCSRCPKVFSHKNSLVRHEKLPHSEQDYLANSIDPTICSKCGQDFPSKEEKLKHMTKEHGENLFKCSQCPKVFFHKNSLVRHEKLPHSEQDYLANSIDPTLKIKEEPKETDEDRSEETTNADEDKWMKMKPIK